MDILLVDDEPLSRMAIADFVGEQLGHNVVQCENGQKALELFQDKDFPLVITDVKMPGISGLDLLSNLKLLPQGKKTDVIIMTGHGDMEMVVQVLRKGACDFLRKPIDVERLAEAIDKSVAKQKQHHKDHQNTAHKKTKEPIKDDFLERYSELPGIGRLGIFSEHMRTAIQIAEKFHEDRSIPVLIEGETGTGKEVIARVVHYGQKNTKTPFISINCSAISPQLFESELFGYEGGSFSGAKKTGMMGKFELAEGGTLFLDEIGELPLDMQPKLLRVLQEKEIYRIGGLKKISLDVRIVCATNRNLEEFARQGKFRKDLFYRLNMGRIYIPALRERPEDIGPLAQMFLTHFATKKKRRFRFIHPQAIKKLESYSWPGNVRELENTMERVALVYDGIEVSSPHLAFLTSAQNVQMAQGNILDPGSIVLPDKGFNLEELEGEIIRKALLKHNGNKTKTAIYLGITRSVFRSKLKKALTFSS